MGYGIRMKRVIDKGADKAEWMHRLVCTSVDQQQTKVHIFMLSINIKLPYKPHTVLVHQYDEEPFAPAARSIDPFIPVESSIKSDTTNFGESIKYS